LDKAPDAFRTISEVAGDLDIPQHVLRFWETRFTQIKPMKRSGSRRYYRPDDVDLLRGIRRLLYGEGYTIRGVQRILKENGIKAVQGLVDGTAAPAFAADGGAKRRVIEDGHDDAPELEADIDDDEEEEAVAPVMARREPEMMARREQEIAAPLPRVNSPRPQASAMDSRPAPAPPSPAPRLDRARLEAVLRDLVACRQVLDTVMKEG
jgi:DNA-binding transcriptional MerR regulator